MTSQGYHVPRAIAPANAQSMTLHLASVPEPPMSSLETSLLPSLYTYVPSGATHSRNASGTTFSSIDSPELTATITTLVDEPLFLPSYLATADYPSSPHRTMSSAQVYSLPDDVAPSDYLELNFPELLAEETSFVDQQCNCAEAIRFVSHGPPKVVDLMRADRPRSARRASSMMFKRPSQRPSISPVQPAQIRTSSISSVDTASSDSSVDRKTTSSQADSPRMPSLDDTPDTSDSEYGSPTIPTPKTSFEAQRKSIVQPVQNDMISSMPSRSSLRSHMKKPSRLALLLPKRSTSSNVPQSAIDIRKALPLTPVTPRTPNSARPASSFFLHTNLSKSKLVARGANERAPTFEIPPMPKSATYPAPRSVTSSSVPTLKDPILTRTKSKSVSRSHVIRRIESKMGLNLH